MSYGLMCWLERKLRNDFILQTWAMSLFLGRNYFSAKIFYLNTSYPNGLKGP